MDGIKIIKETADMKNNKTYSFKALFKIFFKIGRKRLLITTISGAILFLALTAFFISWITYRYNFFYDSVGSTNWINDGKISNKIIKQSEGSITISPSYFNNRIDESIQKLEDIIPKIGKKNTAALYTQLNYFEINSTEKLYMKFMTFDDRTLDVVENSLIEGRMPTNLDEILFYRTNYSIGFSLNQIITLGNNNSLTSHIYDYTIVGIVENVDNNFIQFSKSVDTLRNILNYDSTNYDEILITTNDLYVENSERLINYQGKTGFLIDFNYEFQPIHVRNTAKYLRNFYEEVIDDYFWDIDSFCLDLFHELDDFHTDWLNETLSIFSCGIPILLVFGLICVEIFKIDNHTVESKFKIMKVQGMEYNAIRKMILLENFINASITLVSGVLLGILVGFFIYLGMGNYGLTDFILSLGEPVMLLSIIILYLLFFIGGYIIENILAKKTTKTVPMHYKKKRTIIIKNIFTAQEFLLSLPGTVFIAIGLLGSFFMASVNIYSAFGQYAYDLLFVFWFIAIIGFIFELTAIFLFLSRTITYFWGLIGKKIWERSKSFLTLSLKHISISNENYQRVILAIFIIGLGITPGIILKKSVNDHIGIESKLSVGYSDIMIYDWSSVYDPLIDDIKSIEGIEKVTQIKINYIYSYSTISGEQEYSIHWFSLLNVTEFLEVINPQLFVDSSLSSEDINELNNNMSYLMSEKYARKNNYNRGDIFVTSMITSPYGTPYDMNYTNSFDIFPLMEQFDRNYFDYYDRFGIVTSEFTSSQILDYTAVHVSIVTTSYVLVKTSTDANFTNIKKELTDFGLKTISQKEAEESHIAGISYFGLNLFRISAFITIIAALFIGYIAARNIYYQRLRIIESEYQLGAKRKQIWSGFTIELFLIAPIPILLSFAITLPILNYLSSYILYLPEYHLIFHLWIPIWLFLLIIGLIALAIFSGWLPEIIYLVRKYRPIKQE